MRFKLRGTFFNVVVGNGIEFDDMASASASINPLAQHDHFETE